MQLSLLLYTSGFLRLFLKQEFLLLFHLVNKVERLLEQVIVELASSLAKPWVTRLFFLLQNRHHLPELRHRPFGGDLAGPGARKKIGFSSGHNNYVCAIMVHYNYSGTS